jgi:hypothetical protein
LPPDQGGAFSAKSYRATSPMHCVPKAHAEQKIKIIAAKRPDFRAPEVRLQIQRIWIR